MIGTKKYLRPRCGDHHIIIFFLCASTYCEGDRQEQKKLILLAMLGEAIISGVGAMGDEDRPSNSLLESTNRDSTGLCGRIRSPIGWP